MSQSDEFKNQKYQEVLEEELSGLSRRRQFDKNCTIEDLEGTLRNMYIRDGADIDGRGSLQDIIFAARIAAYERFIGEWKAEIKL